METGCGLSLVLLESLFQVVNTQVRTTQLDRQNTKRIENFKIHNSSQHTVWKT